MSKVADVIESSAAELRARWMAFGGRIAEHERVHACFPRALAAAVEILRAYEAALPLQGVLESAEALAGACGRMWYEQGTTASALVEAFGALRELLLDAAWAAGVAPDGVELRALHRLFDRLAGAATSEVCAASLAELRAAETRLHAFADRAPAMVFEKDAQGRYTLVNAAMERLLGLPRGAILGRTHAELVGSGRARSSEEVDARVLAGEVVETEEEALHTDAPRTYAVLKFPLDSERGRTLGCIAMDVTARKMAERAALHAGELLELGDAFFELDRQWRYVRVNRKQERLSGKSRWETLGRSFWEVWPDVARPDSMLWQEYHRVMEERIEREFEDYYAPLRLWTGVTAYPVTDGGIAVFFRDVTERKNAEGEREAARALERQLLGIVSHDLRTPLNAVVLGAKAMLRRGYLDDRHTAVAARILASGERATRLINDLLDFARVRYGAGLELRLRPTELGRVVQQAVEEITPAFPDRIIRVETRGPVEGEWDADRLLQLVSNLLTNACKYGRVGTEVVVDLSASQGVARLSVHNEGSIVDPAMLPTLFDPFQRGPAEPSPSGALQRSTGLGLFIVRHIVEAHGGEVSVNSSAEEGTTFMVALPLRTREAPDDAAGDEETPASSSLG